MTPNLIYLFSIVNVSIFKINLLFVIGLTQQTVTGPLAAAAHSGSLPSLPSAQGLARKVQTATACGCIPFLICHRSLLLYDSRWSIVPRVSPIPDSVSQLPWFPTSRAFYSQLLVQHSQLPLKLGYLFSSAIVLLFRFSIPFSSSSHCFLLRLRRRRRSLTALQRFLIRL